ncbi:hypothetical protein [Aquimarina muelleri]|uniref:Adhesin domain-containing protein n=1 Tax=Aquimarina muelleri TaxID=279356 RepID=A0A918K016_9FLAO|nr:hypothetical protein [Aquimarina muelleri]MCX2763361.1 hypothetical protein [Aquimarina muelleri]GGX28510.1 hypothetical protein GCM10007384_32140 [Aquimarina muelleri]
MKKTYPLTNAGELHLENRYGNVTISGWEKKTIQINVEIQVTKKKKEDADELLNRINMVVNNTEDFINISSIIEDQNNSLLSKLFDKANPFDFDKSNIQIDYSIHLPFNAEINIINKFGDIIISSWNGKLKANLQHGDMWLNKDLHNANIEMKFGKLKTKSITYGNIHFKNGEIDIETSEDLKINSSGAIIEIENVESLEIHSSKDRINIQKIGNINGELKFSNMNLSILYDNINLTMEVADLWVSKIEKTNANVNIIQESSELDINISGLTIDFRASLEQGLLRIPKSFRNIKTNVIDKRKRIRDITATYGNDKIAGKFKITGKKGAIVLKE